MNTELWDKIEVFDLDQPISEYGFSTRLANENLWTKNFTQKAITEYKKFMYLAATSGYLVSPSEIVDVVWHQHLIFTQSYAAFCKVLGKNIQHIPSTHNHGEAAKFIQAKERTAKLYDEAFGVQPGDIWNCDSINETLALKRMKFDTGSCIVLIVFLLVVAGFLLFNVLRPVYASINNPGFLAWYVAFVIIAPVFLANYNHVKFKNLLYQLPKHAFIYNLAPLELIYLQTGKLSSAIHAVTNMLIKENKLGISNNKTIQLKYNREVSTIEDFTIMEEVKLYRQVDYPLLVKSVVSKPFFVNIASSVKAFKKYFLQTQAFAKIFLFNLVILALIFWIGVLRFATGIVRERPVLFIGITLAVTLVVFTIFLVWSYNYFFKVTVPQFYKETILPGTDTLHNWQWQYFLHSAAAITPLFLPLVTMAEIKQRDSSSDSGGCGGGSCGGGSCGGGSCGGGGGCGGCGGGD